MGHITWHIGCSGFYYKEWKAEFYPKGLAQFKWFEHYASHFSTVEINNTFYRFPQLSLFQSWHTRSPENFRFSVKVPRTITHLQKFNGTENILNEFYAVAIEGLSNKLGPLLFQLPPQMQFSEEMLEKIILQLDPSFRNVIEFRHESWWRSSVIEALHKANICFCGVSFPGLPDEAIVSADFAYYRFHGVPKLYHSFYSEMFIDKIVARMKASLVKEAYIYFNNTASGAALQNAKYLQTITSPDL